MNKVYLTRLATLVFLIPIVSISINVFGKPARPPEGRLTSQKYAVRVSAVVQVQPPQIALQWPVQESYSYTIYRRFDGEKYWLSTPIATLDGQATGYVDTKVKPQVVYEYRIDRIGKGFIGRGYITCGIQIPLTEQRGTVILLTDKSVAPKLKLELQRLEQDLIGDGWQVIRHDVDRDASVVEIKKIIVQDYQKNPKQVKTVFLFGHIPVPYSGSIAPDGHPNHRGAWPADLYYGDIDGIWPDEKKLEYVERGNQKNVPGDGKFDLDTVEPNSIELEVGRVDLSDMPAFDLNETELLRQYLNKDHFFRHNVIQAPARGLVDDNFGSFRGEAFGSSAWSNFTTFFSAANVKAADFISTLHDNPYLWAYGNGGGSNLSANGIGRTPDFVKNPPKAVFTMLFGSYFGDWNHPNNFMRAPLASSGYALTCAWDGRPHWYFHHMALGRTMGYCTLRTQNNHPFEDYLACNDVKSSVSGKDEDAEWEYNPIHVALMGDPTLRMYSVEPPRSIKLIRDGDQDKLTWSPVTAQNVVGYHLYIADNLKSPFKRLTQEPLTEPGFSTSKANPDSVYMIKTIALTTTASGSYFNSSQGVFARLSANATQYQTIQIANAQITLDEDHPAQIQAQTTQGADQALLWSTPYQPNHGRITAQDKGEYTYQPNPDYFGIDKALIVAWDGLNDSNPATILIQIDSVPDSPRASDQRFSLPNTKPFDLTLQAFDPDGSQQALTYVITDAPKHGTLTGTLPNMLYTPSENMTQTDTFQFTASDGQLTSSPATVTLVPPHPAPQTTTPKQIDGQLTDWENLPISCTEPEEFKISNKSLWQGPQDCRFDIGTAYDDQYLYIAVRVFDDEYVAKKDKAPWTQDGIEIRVDARPVKQRSAKHNRRNQKNYILFALSPSLSADDPWFYKADHKPPKGVKYACVKSDVGFNTEIAIPMSYVIQQGGQNWDGFRLSVCVDDRDQDGLIQIWWKPDWRYGKTYWGSGSFYRD